MKVRAIDLLPELVAIPSISGDEEACAQFASDVLARARLDVERIGASVVARAVRGVGTRLLLNSHLDTVPVGAGWTREPFGARWDGDTLFGRGSNDAKASVAAMIAALIELSARDDWRGEIWLALTACEETTNAGMREVLDRIGPPDASITGEPTGLEVVRAQSGLAVITAEWRGRACHAAHVGRVEHENALLIAASELAGTAPYVALERKHELLGESTVVATVARAGERSNVIPECASATFDARLTPAHRASDVVAALRKRMPRAHLAIHSERLKPVETSAEHPLVHAALRAAGKTHAIGSSTLSDMALLGSVPCIKCGPGETARSHTQDEFVKMHEVEAGERFYTHVVPDVLARLEMQVERGVRV